METVGEYITHVSTQLNDQKHDHAFTRWGRGLLLSYLNNGLSEIAAYRPEVFTEVKELSLVAGSRQSILSGVIASPVGNADGTPISDMDIELTKSFNTYDMCPPGVKFVNGNPRYVVRSLGVDNTNQHVYYVDPPVPDGMGDVTIKANVIGNAPIYTLEDWDDRVDLDGIFSNPLISYMLAQAYRLDNESANSRANSTALYKQFYSVMATNYKMQAKYSGGNYLAEDKAVGNG